MGDYGLKISPPGTDVLTAQDKDLVFTSKYPTLKIFDIQSINFTTGSGDHTETYNHSLGFTPIVQASVYYYLYGSYQFRGTLPFQTDGGESEIAADSSHVYIRIQDFSGIQITGTLYIFADKIE